MTTPRQIAKDLERFIEREVRGLAADVTRNLADATPKRTGFAAASWIPVTGGTDDLQISPEGDVGKKRGEQERPLSSNGAENCVKSCSACWRGRGLRRWRVTTAIRRPAVAAGSGSEGQIYTLPIKIPCPGRDRRSCAILKSMFAV